MDEERKSKKKKLLIKVISSIKKIDFIWLLKNTYWTNFKGKIIPIVGIAK